MIRKRTKVVAKVDRAERGEDGFLFGRLRGIAEEIGDIVGPAAPPDSWELLKEWDELNRNGPGRTPRRR